jgi:antirestriction protein ArdC
VGKAEAILSAMQELTGLKINYGKHEACYVPALDEVRLPVKKSFKSVCDLYSVAMHECSHATLHAKRFNRTEAIGKRWGDEAYTLQKLRVEISSAILASTLGIEATEKQREKHFVNHVGYLQSWIKSIRKDPMAIFSAAKDAQQMAEYIIGIERKKSAMAEHSEWIAEYDATPLADR